MIREKINTDWMFVRNLTISVQNLAHSTDVSGVMVNLPHDAMIHEERSADVPSRNQTGFYPGGVYCYVKKLFIPDEYREQKLTLEFEGIYKNAAVYINGAHAGGCHNGYTEFLVETDGFLRYGEENELKVVVNNAAQPSSRWYTGSGLYRGVNLLRSTRTHITSDGIRMKTIAATSELAALSMRMELVNENSEAKAIEVIVEIMDAQGSVVSRDALPMTVYGHTKETLLRSMQIHNPLHWDCDNPYLYRYCVRLMQGDSELDREEGRIGVRMLLMDGTRGLILNGKPIKLHGTCIHHDNGILGACAFDKAEYRKCRQLKGAGFNCIRSAHNPISRAMLDACDELGMLVMDEYSDVWTLPKNTHDDAQFFASDWQRDLTSMVRKDFNHPSVIFYCLGNEIPEAGTERGAYLCRQMDAFIKDLDASRLTINGTNALLACSARLREVIGDLLRGRSMSGGQAHNGDMDGVSAVNSFAALIHGPLGDAMFKHPIVTEMLTPFLNATDVTGLNYMPSRYALEGELYPDRLVLGTEDYPADIVRLWGLVKQYPHVIGDMTWTGYDYIGEAGIGIFYYDGTVNFTPHWPDRLANIGDINILGYRRPISYLREIVYGLRKAPYIAVMRMDKSGMDYGKTPWMFKDNIASWTWPSHEGDAASVDVYSDADQVELLLNGVSLGVQPAGEARGFTATFRVPYASGILTARAIRDGKASEEFALETANDDVSLSPLPEGESLNADGEDILFIPVCLKDAKGRTNLHAQKAVNVSVEGAAVLAAFGSAVPDGLGTFDDQTWPTYDGQLMAVIRAGTTTGRTTVTFSSEGCASVTVDIDVKERHTT